MEGVSLAHQNSSFECLSFPSIAKAPDYFLGVDLAPEISLRHCGAEFKMRPEGLIVFDIGSFPAPAALALEVHGFTILEYWWVAPKGPVLSHTAEVAGRFHFLNDPDEAQEHFLKEQALLHPDAVCGLIACPATGDAPHISDEQILLLWQRIVSVFGFRSLALINLCSCPLAAAPQSMVDLLFSSGLRSLLVSTVVAGVSPSRFLEELEISRLRMLRDATPATSIAETFSMLLLPFFQSCLTPLDSCVAPLWATSQIEPELADLREACPHMRHRAGSVVGGAEHA